MATHEYEIASKFLQKSRQNREITRKGDMRNVWLTGFVSTGELAEKGSAAINQGQSRHAIVRSAKDTAVAPRKGEFAGAR